MMMTSEEVLEMARQVGLCRTQSNFDDWIDAGPSGYELEAFAKLVDAKATAREREACAQLCDKLDAEVDKYPAQCAQAIRARGET